MSVIYLYCDALRDSFNTILSNRLHFRLNKGEDLCKGSESIIGHWYFPLLTKHVSRRIQSEIDWVVLALCWTPSFKRHRFTDQFCAEMLGNTDITCGGENEVNRIWPWCESHSIHFCILPSSFTEESAELQLTVRPFISFFEFWCPCVPVHYFLLPVETDVVVWHSAKSPIS